MQSIFAMQSDSGQATFSTFAHSFVTHLLQLLEKEKTNVVVEVFDQYRSESIKQDTQEQRH